MEPSCAFPHRIHLPLKGRRNGSDWNVQSDDGPDRRAEKGRSIREPHDSIEEHREARPRCDQRSRSFPKSSRSPIDGSPPRPAEPPPTNRLSSAGFVHTRPPRASPRFSDWEAAAIGNLPLLASPRDSVRRLVVLCSYISFHVRFDAMRHATSAPAAPQMRGKACCRPERGCQALGRTFAKLTRKNGSKRNVSGKVARDGRSLSEDQRRERDLEMARQSVEAAVTSPHPSAKWVSRYADDEPRKGCDVLVECLEREGVDTVFAYPGGASMEIHQALTRSKTIRNILCRHEQGEIFAAEGYAKCTGKVSVCIATSGPGATNLVTGLADAMLDSVPMVAITGQVPRRMIGTDAFQETPIVEISRTITKHNYLVMDVEDLPRIMREAFYLASTGRPGPVLVDIPKDVQQQMVIPKYDVAMAITGYIERLPPPPSFGTLQEIVKALSKAKRPVVYAGGGCVNAHEELREFVQLTGTPVAQTLMGLGNFPASDSASLAMLGMHGTVTANYAIDRADLLLSFGVRFDDRVTGKLEAFAQHATIVHIDVDPAEIGKNKHAHISLCADIRASLSGLNDVLRKQNFQPNYGDWMDELAKNKVAHPMRYPERDDCIVPQWAIQVLHEETKGEAIVSTGVGQHQMWAAQWYGLDYPRSWLTSGGLGSMGFGLPSALGAAVAFDGRDGRPKRIVVDIDGDGSFLMNCQELATICVEKLDVKMMILNNQHLGMVVQWEDRFYKANRAHTYLGRRESEWHETQEIMDIYPDFVKMAESCGVKGERVIRKEDLRPAIRRMLDTEGPYLLDVMVPHIEHVLPMIPGGGSFKDIITEGDGTDTY